LCTGRAFIDAFATTNLGGRGPAWLEFGADGYLYTTGSTTSLCCEKSIVRFNGTTGEFVDRFDVRRDGWAFTLHHDPTHGVVVYNASNGHGNFVERFVSSTNPDPTKFYVVDDGNADSKTYEYGSGAGAPGESYPLVNNNAAPRGSAVWGFTNLVVDVNMNVYVYSPHGELLGSWLAGGLDARAQLEGVAVHSGVVWLVDTQQDKVYRYTNAAARLSGTQNASSYFNLNTANTNPKDIVTDGTYLWVVDDSQTDKVFKYELDGALVGSWTISTPDASNPTGVTLDRGNPDHLWIVDAASDRVYQYDGAVTLTGGSQSASTSFLLSDGNTNPQGIAGGIGVATISDHDVAGDANGDGIVNLDDLNAVRNNFGASGANVAGDTNGDGLVNLDDLNAVRNNFGAVAGNGRQQGSRTPGSLNYSRFGSVTQSQQRSLQATDVVFDMLMLPRPTKNGRLRR
jgi:hypothetical protein